MAEKRNHQRINCAEKCLLYFAGSKYCGAVMNISITGALVTLYNPAPDTIRPGDTCSLIFNNDHSTAYFKYKSRITRVNSVGLGLEILEHDF